MKMTSMKNTLLPFILVAFALTCFICGCKKKCTTAAAADDPMVTVTSPIEGKTYTGSIEMSFSVASVAGLDTCTMGLFMPVGSGYLYFNNFNLGADVRNKNSFNFSASQSTLPTNLTDAQCIIKVVNRRNISAVKVINVKVKQ